MRPVRWHRWAWLLIVALVGVLAPARLSAQEPPPFELSTLRERAPLRSHLTAYRDPEGTLTLEQLRAAPPQPTKLPSDIDTSFGYDRATLWLKFRVRNASAHAQPFMIDLDFPHIDHVTLHVLHEDGRREQHVTGDMLPFAQREVRHSSFVFRLEQTAHSESTYYLRVQTSGALKVPLVIWQRKAFLEYHQEQSFGLWMFYGALLVLTLYNLGVYLMLWQREYLAYVAFQLSLLATVVSLNGHTFQYLLPNHPLQANHALPASMALAVITGGTFAKFSIGVSPGLASEARIAGLWTPIGVVLFVFACTAEPGLALRVMIGALSLVLVHGVVELFRLVRAREPELRLYILSWLPLMLASPVQVLRYMNVLGQSVLAEHGAGIAIALHGVITSLMLASRLNSLRRRTTDLNEQLSRNVSELQTALGVAQEAREEARRATLAKDEFLATMSHELRTPLNAIINVPQGLLDEFADQPSARCEACGATFELEPDEQVEPGLACPDCQVTGQLVATTRIAYEGDPARTTHFLRRIERSGRSLLQMVNGVLDFSKIEAGHLSLQPLPADVGVLLREAIDETGDLTSHRKQRIDLVLADRPLPSVVDPVRVKQIVVNLLSNAAKFSDEGRTITVAWQATPEADIISVRDRGIGIDAADHERVFQRFEQVHKGNTRKYGGTGLGLPISRSLARMHGGDLTVDSVPGRGSTFTLTLPRQGGKRRASLRNSDAAE